MEIHDNNTNIADLIKFDDIKSIDDFSRSDIRWFDDNENHRKCCFDVEYDSEPMHLYLLDDNLMDHLKNENFLKDDTSHVCKLDGLGKNIYLNGKETKALNEVFREQFGGLSLGECQYIINVRNALNAGIDREVFKAENPHAYGDVFFSPSGGISIGPRIPGGKFKASEYKDYRSKILAEFDAQTDIILSNHNSSPILDDCFRCFSNSKGDKDAFSNFIDTSIRKIKDDEKHGIKSAFEVRNEEKNNALYESGVVSDYFEDDDDSYAKNDPGFYEAANVTKEKSMSSETTNVTKEKPMSSYAKLKVECERSKDKNEESKTKNGSDMIMQTIFNFDW